MNRQKAAALLGVSLRTLDKYRAEGRLSFRYEKGKTRNVVVFEEADVRALKLRLLAERDKARPKASPQAESMSPAVSFHVDRELYQKLSEEGAKWGMSPHQYARQLMVEGMNEELKGRVEELSREIARQREVFTDAFCAVLEYVGMNETEAARWVEAELSSPS